MDSLLKTATYVKTIAHIIDDMCYHSLQFSIIDLKCKISLAIWSGRSDLFYAYELIPCKRTLCLLLSRILTIVDLGCWLLVAS